MTRKEFGARLKQLRLIQKLTQAQVAKHLGLSFSQSVAAFESGRVRFPDKHVTAYCKLMHLKESAFLELMVKVYADELTSKFPTKRKLKAS